MLSEVVDTLSKSKHTYTEVYQHKLRHLGHPDENRLICLGMIFQMNKPTKECLPILKKRLEEYGARSKTNMQNGGVDWKAYSHAFRLMYEWEELLTKGKLVFPIPNREFVLDVKLGKYDFEEVQDKLFDEFTRIQALPNNLPKPDQKFWEDFILQNYLY
jgi:hypothetical protein